MTLLYIFIIVFLLFVIVTDLIMQTLVAKEIVRVTSYTDKMKTIGKEIGLYDLGEYWDKDNPRIYEKFKTISTLISPVASPQPDRMYVSDYKRVYIVKKPYFGYGRFHLYKYWVIELTDTNVSEAMPLEEYSVDNRSL